MKAAIATYRSAFPDMTARVEEQVAQGDTVVSRWSATGTSTGALQGIPPTGKQVTVVGVNLDRFKDGKVVWSWGIFDQFGMLVQLGVVPPPGG
jgi:predicted ester cyclase